MQDPIIRTKFLPVQAVFVLWALLAIMLAVAFYYPFPSGYDELQHYSVIRAQYEDITLFPNYSAYRVVDVGDLTHWSVQGNYINHPSPYYIVLSPLISLTRNVVALRIANVVMTFSTIFMIVMLGCRILVSRAEMLIFTVIAVSFPKYALIGGMINNDNLCLVAAALVFAGLVQPSAATLSIALGLSLAGWSKLTAFIALGSVVGFYRFARMLSGETLWSKANAMILLAGLFGSTPYIVNLLSTGKILYINLSVYEVPEKKRIILNFWQFSAGFFKMLVNKWPASEGTLPLSIAALTVLTPLALAVAGARLDSRVRQVAYAYGAGLLVTVAAHLWFGWQAFRSIGDLTIAQTRYYNILWPGIALTSALGLARLTHKRTWLRWPALVLILLPTIPGGMLVAFS